MMIFVIYMHILLLRKKNYLSPGSSVLRNKKKNQQK